MTITMRFSSSRIDDLNAQTSKNDFKNNYEQLLLSNMSSNYYNWERYSKLKITIQSGWNWFDYLLQNEAWEEQVYTGFYNINLQITKITTNQEDTNTLDIELNPYKLDCKINNKTGSQAIIEVQTKNNSNCFSIFSNTCKLENTTCQ
jgi:hypothetical protein